MTEADIGILFITIGIIWIAINIFRPNLLIFFSQLVIKSRISHAIFAFSSIFFGLNKLNIFPSVYFRAVLTLVIISYIAIILIEIFEYKKEAIANKEFYKNIGFSSTKKNKYNHQHNESRHSKFRKK